MSKIIKKTPLPITGLMLGLVALGNLLQSHSESLRSILGAIAGLIFLLVISKVILYREDVRKDMENPVIASVFPTFSMATILFATYLKPMSNLLANVFWFGGLILHILLMISFTRKFILNGNYSIKKVFPSWFIPYVGIAVASVSSGAVGMQGLGRIIFWFALVSFVVLLPIILKRVFMVKEIPAPAQACIGILAAPASLSLVGYMNAFEEKNLFLVYGLLLVAQVLYWTAILYLPMIFKGNFFPSFSGFTFPLVISGLALKLSNGFLSQAGKGLDFLPTLVKLEEGIALLVTLYVLIRYTAFLFAKAGEEKPVRRAISEN